MYVLRQAEAGTPVEDVCRGIGVSVATFYIWKKKYGDEKIPIFAEYNYDMVKIAAKAIDKGGYTADGIRQALFVVAKGYKGVTGDKTFDADRGVRSDFGVWTVKNGQIVDYKK